MPRKDAILQGEIALGALEGRFWLPGSSVCIGSRAPAQGVHPSALEALGFFHLYSFVRSSPCNGQTFIRSNDSLGRPHCTVPPLRAELSFKNALFLPPSQNHACRGRSVCEPGALGC